VPNAPLAFSRPTELVNLLHSKAIRTGVAFAISGGLLWFTLHGLDFGELERVLKSSSVTWIGVSLALYWLEMAVRAMRWRMLLRPVAALTAGQVLLSLVIGYAANNALPARLGEVFRAHFLGKRYSVSRPAAMATIVVERLLDVVAVLACAAAGLAVMAGDGDQATLSRTRSNIVTGLIVATVVALVLVLALYALAAYGRTAMKRGSARRQRVFASALAGLQPVSRPAQLLSLIAPTVLVWVCNGLSMAAVLLAVGIHPSAPTVALLLGVAGIAAALPAAPANLGTLQYAFIVSLGAAGHAAAPAFAAATLVQVFLLGSVTLAGALLYAAKSGRPTRAGDMHVSH
jgi:uncharacterized protein (TIRG00374 family)